MTLWNRKNKKTNPSPSGQTNLIVASSDIIANLKNKTDSDRAAYASTGEPSDDEFLLLANDPSGEVRENVASNPFTPPPVLHLIALGTDEKIMEAVAGNTSSAPKTLTLLARRNVPRLGASRTSRLALTNPNCPLRLIQETVANGDGDLILGSPQLDADMLETIFVDITERVEFFNDVLESYQETPDDAELVTRILAYTGEQTLPEALATLQDSLAAAQENCETDYSIIAAHPQTPPHILALLRKPENATEETLAAVASNLNTPSETLLSIMVEEPVPFAFFAAQNITLQPAHIREYAQKAHLIVSGAAETTHTGTGSSFDEEFADIVAHYTDKNSPPAQNFSPATPEPSPTAQNPYRMIPQNKDDDYSIDDEDTHKTIHLIIALAEHPNTPPDILLQMFQYGPLSLAEIIASNPKAPDYVLTTVFTHASTEIARLDRTLDEWVASTNFDSETFPDTDMFNDTNFFENRETLHDILCALAQNPATPLNLFGQLHRNKDWTVKTCLAQNPKLPAVIAARLAAEDVEEIQQALAENLATAPTTLTLLTRSRYWKVRLAAVRNPNTLHPALHHLHNDKHPEVAREAALRRENR